jgi:hypothetical protein
MEELNNHNQEPLDQDPYDHPIWIDICDFDTDMYSLPKQFVRLYAKPVQTSTKDVLHITTNHPLLLTALVNQLINYDVSQYLYINGKTIIAIKKIN